PATFRPRRQPRLRLATPIGSQVGHRLLEACVLLLQLAEPLHVVGLQAAVLKSPARVGRLGDAELLTHVGDRGAGRKFEVGLAQLADDLFGRMTLPLHRESSCPSGRLDSHTTWTRKGVAGHDDSGGDDPSAGEEDTLQDEVWGGDVATDLENQPTTDVNGPTVTVTTVKDDNSSDDTFDDSVTDPGSSTTGR